MMAMSVFELAATFIMTSAAEKLTYEAITMSRAFCTPRSVGVPFVVVMMIVSPSTTAGVNACGEFPMSNPVIGYILCSPASRIWDRAKSFDRVITSSAPSTGSTVLAPLPSAVATVVDARRTSTITTSRPAVSMGFTWFGVKKTSSRTEWLLHQFAFALEELGVNCPVLEMLVGHDSGKEWNGGGDPLDDEALECDLHSAERLLPVAPLTNELGDQRIVERRNGETRIDVGVEANSR